MNLRINALMDTALLCKGLAISALIKIRTMPPWLFLAELIKNPGAVGAVWPSSKPLAFAMARQVPATGEGLIVELGAGTGAVTGALLDSGISPDRLLVVERSASFVQHLRDQYPTIQVVQGDAAQLHVLVPPNAVVDAIVSSLPLRSLNTNVVSEVIAQWHKVLKPEGIVVQFTYNLRSLIQESLEGFREQKKCLVWANIPPARVSKLARHKA